jgi:ABC-2 type transport system permease protein
MSNTIISQKIYAQLLSSFEKFLQNLSSTLGFNRETVSQPIIIENEFYGSQDSPFTDFFAPGILMVCISTMPLIVASFMLVKERRGGHLERVFVADVKPSEILLINIIMLFIANVFQVLLLLILAFYIYDLTLRGSFFNAFGLIVSQCMQWTSFGYFLSLCFADEYSVMVCFE